jgi:hypothetical protein
MIDKLIYNFCGNHLQRITAGDKRLIRIYSTESDGSVERDEKKHLLNVFQFRLYMLFDYWIVHLDSQQRHLK